MPRIRLCHLRVTSDARIVISDWKDDYDHYRRHSALGNPTPRDTLLPASTDNPTHIHGGPINGVPSLLHRRLVQHPAHPEEAGPALTRRVRSQLPSTGSGRNQIITLSSSAREPQERLRPASPAPATRDRERRSCTL
ncbi:integrase core domain-containing protein [Nocardia wallacei]|uniref:integrase core domain-containing protein n=1 Tax=Nocardia wallacei TaxID=480035 RepID=UPI003CC9191A